MVISEKRPDGSFHISTGADFRVEMFASGSS